MKLAKVAVAEIALLNPDEEGGAYAFIIHLNMELKHGREPIGLGISMAAEIPYDASLTFAEIARRSVIKAREMLGIAANTNEDVWLDLHKQSLQPPRRFTLDSIE